MTFLSLKGTLIYALRQVLFSADEESSLHFTDFLYNGSFATSDWLEIPLTQKEQTADVLYISAIPQMLRRREKANLPHTPANLSKYIVNQLRNSKSKLLNNERKHKSCDQDHKAINNSIVSQLWDEFEIGTQRAGWISFRLSKGGVSLWLRHLNERLSDFINHLLEQPHFSSQSGQISSETALNSPQNDPQIWHAQYIHGRCCCLLRIWNAQVETDYQVKNKMPLEIAEMIVATTEGAILKQNQSSSAQQSPPQNRSTKYLTEPSASSESASLSSLSRGHPSRGHLSRRGQVIHDLVALVDLAESDLFWIPYRWPSKQYFLLLKAICQLCQSFEQFLAVDLSQFGKMNKMSSIVTKRHFQANFALALIIQKTLKILLERGFGVPAPMQL